MKCFGKNSTLFTTCHSVEESEVIQKRDSNNIFLKLKKVETKILSKHFSKKIGTYENGFGSLYYHQSGTIANDVYRKNSVISIYQKNK